MKHTQGKWEVESSNTKDDIWNIIEKKDNGIFDCVEIAKVYSEANAKRIVQCVNSHDKLLEALGEARTAIYDAMLAGNLSREYAGCVMDKIEQAITKAEEETMKERMEE